MMKKISQIIPKYSSSDDTTKKFVQILIFVTFLVLVSTFFIKTDPSFEPGISIKNFQHSYQNTTCRGRILLLHFTVPLFDRKGSDLRFSHLITALRSEGYSIVYLSYQKERVQRRYHLKYLKEEFGAEVYIRPTNLQSIKGYESIERALHWQRFKHLSEKGANLKKDYGWLHPSWQLIKYGTLRILRESDKLAFFSQENLKDIEKELPHRKKDMSILPYVVIPKEKQNLNTKNKNNNLIKYNPNFKKERQLIEIKNAYQTDPLVLPFEKRNGFIFFSYNNPEIVGPFAWFIENVFDKLPNNQDKIFHVAGSICRSLKSRYSQSKDIILHGIVSENKLSQMLSSVKMMINPSIGVGGISTKNLHSMERGLPFVFTFDSMRAINLDLKIIEPQKLPICNSYDNECFHKFTNLLLNDKQYWETISKIAYIHIREKFQMNNLLTAIHSLSSSKDNNNDNDDNGNNDNKNDDDDRNDGNSIGGNDDKRYLVILMIGENVNNDLNLFKSNLKVLIKKLNMKGIKLDINILIVEETNINLENNNNQYLQSGKKIEAYLKEINGIFSIRLILSNRIEKIKSHYNLLKINSIIENQLNLNHKKILLIFDQIINKNDINNLINYSKFTDLYCLSIFNKRGEIGGSGGGRSSSDFDLDFDDNDDDFDKNDDGIIIDNNNYIIDIKTGKRMLLKSETDGLQKERNLNLLQVFTCNSPIMLINSKPFLYEKIKFRTPNEFEKSINIPMNSLLSMDLWKYKYQKNYIDLNYQDEYDHDYHLDGRTLNDMQMSLKEKAVDYPPIQIEICKGNKLDDCKYIKNLIKQTIGLIGNLFESVDIAKKNKQLSNVIYNKMSNQFELLTFPNDNADPRNIFYDNDELGFTKSFKFYKKQSLSLGLMIDSTFPPSFESQLQHIKRALLFHYYYGSLPSCCVAQINSNYDEIWVNHDYLKGVLMKDGVANSKIQTIHPLINDYYFSDQVQQLKSESDSVTFLYYGDFSKQSGIDILIDAFLQAFSPSNINKINNRFKDNKDNYNDNEPQVHLKIILKVVTNLNLYLNPKYSKADKDDLYKYSYKYSNSNPNPKQFAFDLLKRINYPKYFKRDHQIEIIDDFNPQSHREIAQLLVNADWLISPFRNFPKDNLLSESLAVGTPLITTHANGLFADMVPPEVSLSIQSSLVKCENFPCNNPKNCICVNESCLLTNSELTWFDPNVKSLQSVMEDAYLKYQKKIDYLKIRKYVQDLEKKNQIHSEKILNELLKVKFG
ncbi:32 kda heat shock protein-related [Anaeramoeba flamelloides]|uniref:32 kDa heat shock protein-related n=1 Tax=Anaeramoeba flamelloides TaxID=1746091 RepID=A0AAV7Y353_9EUKA|nr:32 kda heat shock protein-related [Anaeramoeba flamelloides]